MSFSNEAAKPVGVRQQEEDSLYSNIQKYNDIALIKETWNIWAERGQKEHTVSHRQELTCWENKELARLLISSLTSFNKSSLPGFQTAKKQLL